MKDAANEESQTEGEANRQEKGKKRKKAPKIRVNLTKDGKLRKELRGVQK